jgi:murein DD-endopeptidase MepM/ murein hydrolase activator NlpD
MVSAFILPLEAQILLTTGGLRQGEPGFLVYLAESVHSSETGIPASLTHKRSSGTTRVPAVRSSVQEGFTAVIRYAHSNSGPGFPGLPIPLQPKLQAIPGQDFVLLAGFSPPVKVRMDAVADSLLFLIAVPVDAPVGEAIVSVLRPDGRTVAELRTMVAKRDFMREDIKLSEALTSLRVDADPRKDEQARRLQALLATVDPRAKYLDQDFIRPVAGERRTSFFGDIRRYIYSDNGTAWSIHNGVDYGYPTGTPVWAAGRGRVVLVEDRIVTGRTVVIEHLPGVYTIYMHLDTTSVKTGEHVGREQRIGTIGATGLATGPHLHWELRVSGIACDPEILAGLDKMPRIRTMTDAIEGR